MLLCAKGAEKIGPHSIELKMSPEQAVWSFNMSNIADTIASLESKIANLHAQWAPLSTRSDHLNRKVNDLLTQALEIGSEATAIHEEIVSVFASLESLATTVREAKSEGEQVDRQQQMDQQFRESMTSMFGEAFQVVSRFMDTAQRIGILDKEKAENFLAAKEREFQQVSASPAAEIAKLSLPQLPDVNISTEYLPPVDDFDAEPASDLTGEIASSLGVSPLNLDTPITTTQDKTEEEFEEDATNEDEIEALLNNLSTPIST